MEPPDGLVRVLVLGGGFSGAATATRLVRASGRLVVEVIDPASETGRGPAYGTSSPRRLLNVHAGAMSAFAEFPDDFVDWRRGRDPDATAEDYARRGDYGAYVEDRFRAAVATSGGRLRRVHATARAARRLAGGGVAVDIDGRELRADALVLALGTPGHAVPDGWPSDAAGRDPRFVEDPRRREFSRSDPLDLVLIVGTGLTAVDVVADVCATSPTGRVIAVSRRGLLPLAHVTPAPPPSRTLDASRLIGLPPLSVVREVRTAARSACDWRSTIAALRPATDAIWSGWTEDARRRFLRHALPYWNVHRHRAAPEAAATVERLRREGRFTVIAGRVAAIDGAGREGPLRATVSGRDGETLDLAPTLCVNGAGPDYDVSRSGSPLLESLLASGAARPGPLGSGLDVDAHGALVDAAGAASEDVFVVGALRMGRAFETTAAPDLRRQAAEVAARIATRADARFSEVRAALRDGAKGPSGACRTARDGAP
ncbi:MAG TPA: FAD/NAD(P)-binding protein [Planctomycetota bacterium]|nr:FAD/NAD(P)-binding protein [Planctomycetota bacterium]